jgi:hypothetical protein
MFTMLGLVWHGAVLQDAGWLLLAGFLPALIMVSVHHKKRRGGQRIAFLQHDLELAGDRYFELFAKYKKRNLDGNSRADFNVASFPIICITAICVFFAAILVFTSYFVTDPNSCSMFLEVMQYANGCGHAYPTLVAVSFAYLGWYAWAVSGVFSRLVTMEFMSGSLYALLSRLVLSIIVAAVLYNIWDDVARAAQVTTGWVKADPAFIGFFTGLFPVQTLNYFLKSVRRLGIFPEPAIPTKSLELIEGISAWRMFRLYDFGLDDCENLAVANPIELYEATNLPLLEIIDWISQAQLAVMVDIKMFLYLQRNGVRTAADFERLAGPSASRTVLADLMKLTGDHIAALRQIMLASPNFCRLKALRDRIKETDRRAGVEDDTPGGWWLV